MPPTARPKRGPGRPSGAFTGSKKTGPKEADANRERSFALSYAKDIHVALIQAGDKPELKDLFIEAEAMLKWLNGDTPTVKTSPAAAPKVKEEKENFQKPEQETADTDEKEPEKVYSFGMPEGKVKISNSDVDKIIAAFGNYNISPAELEQISGLPVSEWTPNIRDVARNNYQMVKSGEMSKAELMDV